MISKLHRVPVIQQIEAAECGAASLGMILGYYGRFINMVQLRSDCKISRDGSRLSFVMAAAEKYGMETHARKVPEITKEVPLPCIVFWDANHYLVVERIRGDKYDLCDPAVGRRTLSREEFVRHYSGIVLLLSPTENFKKGGKPFRPLSELFSIVKPDRGASVFLIIVTILLNILGVLIPGMSRIFVDYYVPNIGSVDVNYYFLTFNGILLVQGLVLYLQLTCINRFEWRISSETAAKVVRRLLNLPLGFFERRSHSSLASRLETTDHLCSFVASNLIPMIFNLIFAVLYLAFMIANNLLLTIPVMVFFILVLAVMFKLLRMSKDSSQRSTNDMRSFYGTIAQTVFLYDTLRASALEDQAYSEIRESYNRYQNVNNEGARIGSWMSALSTVIPLVTQLMIITVGGFFLVKGVLTLGGMLSFQSLALAFFTPVCKLIGQFDELQSLTSDIKGTLDILDEPEDPLASRNIGGESLELTGKIELKGVAFGYNPAKPPVVHDIDLEIPAGKSVALVGGSGAGKTTVLRLIEGVLMPSAGEILFDSTRLPDISREDFSAHVGIVTQNPFIFRGTVRDNLSMFDSSIALNELAHAAVIAGIYDDIVAMNGGFDAVLEDGGRNISGGQRQRLMLARALVKKPTVLILDEATSALDTLVEEEIMKNLREMRITTLIVAHRLSTIRDCDKIMVMEKGAIVESGSHQELMRLEDGVYQKLVSVEDGLK